MSQEQEDRAMLSKLTSQKARFVFRFDVADEQCFKSKKRADIDDPFGVASAIYDKIREKIARRTLS